jgi:hypothetical protein
MKASIKIALSVRLETLIFVSRMIPWISGIKNPSYSITPLTPSIRCLSPCFMTLALPRIASHILGSSLTLANKPESSSHGFPFWVTNIMIFSLRARRLSRISTILFVLRSYVWSILSKMCSSKPLLLLWFSVPLSCSENDGRDHFVRGFERDEPLLFLVSLSVIAILMSDRILFGPLWITV